MTSPANSKFIVFKDLNEYPDSAVSLGDMEWNRTGMWTHLVAERRDVLPPCNLSCPASNNIRSVLELFRREKVREAWDVLMDGHPFPAVCGRVCYHECETECTRKHLDEPVSIHLVERSIGDQAIKEGWKVQLPVATSEKSVAVLGGGPAGLSAAYFLARMGYSITIFEKEDELGGMLRYGIPEYRLPRDVTDKEIERILNLGVKARTGCDIESEDGFRELDSFDAIFVAAGAHQNIRIGISEHEGEGVASGLELLKQVARGQTPTLGKRVVVVGGGNTAMDAARSARRLGSRVTVVYRRTKEEMPAHPEEIEEALSEGIEFLYLASPNGVVTENGKITALSCLKNVLGEPDESGRRRPMALPDSDFSVPADTILTAIGEKPEVDFLPETLRTGGKVAVDDNFQVEGKVFAGGDSSSRSRGTVIDAIAQGKLAAVSISAFLLNQELRDVSESQNAKQVELEKIRLDLFPTMARQSAVKLEPGHRLSDFREVNHGLEHKDAVQEAERCLSCGTCTLCEKCYIYCPDSAVIVTETGTEVYREFCKGCGICVRECPRDALELKDKDPKEKDR